ncbi:phage tail protein [Pseudomonas yamanorum]|nr:phage tail protein [Pseudomonas yamanorum]
MSAVAKKPVRTNPSKRCAVIGSKGGEAKQKQPIIASNSVPSLSRARITYLWSWGPIVGPVNGLRSVRLNGTPVQAEDGTINYPGVKWQFRSGELNQERLEGISESSNEIDVKKELQYGTPWLHTIANSVVDAIRLRFSWPTLRKQDSSGNINGVRIDYAVDISTDNGPFIEVLTSFVDRKNLTEYERAHRLELPAGSRWTIRARRLTPEANSDLVVDQMLVKAIAEVVDSDQEFPLTAVGCIEYDAQVFGGDIAKIAVLMRGRIIRVPTNYDAATRTYATGGPGTSGGIWDGTFKEAYTNNPAWIFYDLVLHPYYGLGDRIDATMVDRWALYRIAQYCDQMVPDGKGGQEPRFTCNLYFQKQTEAYAVLQDLASIFRGMAFWDGSQIVVNADMPGDPVFSYGPSQILNSGTIKYEGTRVRDRHTNAMVSWDNPDQGFETDKEPVFDDAALGEYGSVRELTVDAFGCTSLGQAQRAGQWALMTEQLQTRGAVFRVGLDGQIPKPGQVIAVGDPMLAGRANSGRISAVAGRVITLDREVVLPAAARLMINLPSGKSEGRVIKSVSGRDVTVMADYSEIPTPELGWAIDADDLKVMQFYVRNVTRPEWHQFQLEVIQYEPSKFDVIDHGAVVDPRPISGIPVGTQDAPAQVLLSQHVVIEQGIAITVMSIAWDAAPAAVAYDVEWKWGAREWVRVPRTAELMADVRGIYSGQYMARVRAVSALNVSSIPTASMLTNLEGKTGLPPAVAFLTTTSLVYGIGIQWGFPPGAEDTQRTELWYSQSPDQTTAIKLSDFSYPQAKHEMQNILAGASFFFWARLVDRTGNIGPFFPVTGAVNGRASSDQSEYDKYFADKIGKGALYQSLREEIELITGDGPGSVNERLEEAKKEFNDLINEIVDALEYDPAKTYTKGDMVRVGQHLFQATTAVPVNTTPPNASYWFDMGTIAETNEAMALEISKNKSAIDNVDGKVTATAEKLDGVYATIKAESAGDEAGSAGDDTSSAGAWSLMSAIAERDFAQTQRTDGLDAKVGQNAASIIDVARASANATEAVASRVTAMDAKVDSNAAAFKSETTVLANTDKALGERIETVRAASATNASAIQDTNRVMADADKALGEQIKTVQATSGENTAAIQETNRVVAATDGKVSAMKTLKVETLSNGKKVMAGLALGSDGDTSEIIAFAQRFSVVNEIDGKVIPMFTVENNQVFFNTAIISTIFVQQIILGMTLRSEAVDSKGRPLLEIDVKAGTFTLRSSGAGGSSLLNNDGLSVFDAGGVKRTMVGRLS